MMLFASIMLNADAQFTCDFEDCPDSSCLSGDFGFCVTMGDPPLSICSTDFAHSGIYSVKIPDDGTTDAILDLGGKIFGTWGLDFWMYIPSDKEAYFNLQGQVPIGAGEWIVGNIYFNKDTENPGVGYVGYNVYQDTDITFNFPHDEWFQVVINVDLSMGMSSSTWQFGIDGVDTTNGFVPFYYDDFNPETEEIYATSLGGVDFFSISTDNLYYIDDINYDQNMICDPPLMIISTQDLKSKGFESYPNPIDDVLQLRADQNITHVSIYDLLGQELYQATLNTTETSIDMSSFPSGTYFVKVKIGQVEGTTKVMK